MALLTLLAIAAFALLADVRLNQDDLWFPAVSDLASRATMTAVLIVLEVACLVCIALLLFVHRRTEAWTTADWTTEISEPVPAGTPATSIQIGCSGCGTVFEKAYSEVDEPHEQDFRCPNCGRAGHLRMGLHKKVPMRTQTCGNCSREFTAYRETAECPHCHAPQAQA